MSSIDWMVKGPEFANCNCAWGCPCQFNARPTEGDCRAVWAMRIDEGYFGEVRLDGLHWAMLLSWPGAIHEGHGQSQAIIDSRADAPQREALLKILSGEESEPGATVFQVFSSVVDTVHEPVFSEIDFEVDVGERTASLRIPGCLESTGGPIRSPITGSPHRAQVRLPHGFEYLEAEFGSGTTKTIDTAIPLDFSESHSHLATLHLTPKGPVQ